MPATQASSQSRLRSPPLLIVAAVALSALALFGWQSWLGTRDEQLLQLRTVAELTERATDHYFAQMQTALGELAQDIVAADGLRKPRAAQPMLANHALRHRELLAVHLLALDGRYLATSDTPSLGGVPGAGHPHNFAETVATLRPERPLELSRPLLGPAVRRWILPMRYTVRDESGTAVAFIVAAAPVEMLQGYWSQAPVMAHAAVALVRDDGYLLSRYPVPAGADEARVYGQPRDGAVMQHLRANGWPLQGAVEGPSLIDGRLRLSAFKRLEHFPVTLVASTPLATVQAAWWAHVRVPLASTLLLLGTAAVGLHHLHRRERLWWAERERADAEQARRSQAEQQSAELGRLLRERGEMLDVLAHEVRQPLNNASAALQGAASALDSAADGAAPRNLQRAQDVLTDVLAHIDNTLAVATLLAHPEALRREDTDIDMLVNLVIGDMPAGQQSRIVVERLTSTRTAAMDSGLMRLALRNLLSNALQHGGAGPVSVRVADSDEPLALVVEVADQGPGVVETLLPRLFERGTRGRSAGDTSGNVHGRATGSGLGLGLHIVRRVMDLHGGSVQALNRPGQGLTMRLVIDQFEPP